VPALEKAAHHAAAHSSQADHAELHIECPPGVVDIVRALAIISTVGEPDESRFAQ
jgi:hypothetical protein